jgi:AraC-like DNA-binding protein
MTVAKIQLTQKRRARCAAVVLCIDPEDRRAVADALSEWDVDFRDRERDILGALRATGAPLFVTRPFGADEEPHTMLLRGIREDAPAFDIVALKRAGDEGSGAFVALTQLGVGDVLLVDDPDFAERLCEYARRTRLSLRVAECGREVAAGLPLVLARLVHWAFQRGLRCGSVSEFAAAKGVSNDTLRLLLSRIRLTPEELLRWRRVIAAFVLFEHTLLTVDRVAARVGFPSGTALHNAIRRTAGASRPHVLRSGRAQWRANQRCSSMSSSRSAGFSARRSSVNRSCSSSRSSSVTAPG